MKYEAHITVEPGCDTVELTYEEFVARSAESMWKASKFEHDDVDGIAGKWFLSASADNRDVIVMGVAGMVHGLECSGFTVLRWKIEETLYDSKAGDNLDAVISDNGWEKVSG